MTNPTDTAKPWNSEHDTQFIVMEPQPPKESIGVSQNNASSDKYPPTYRGHLAGEDGEFIGETITPPFAVGERMYVAEEWRAVEILVSTESISLIVEFRDGSRSKRIEVDKLLFNGPIDSWQPASNMSSGSTRKFATIKSCEAKHVQEVNIEEAKQMGMSNHYPYGAREFFYEIFDAPDNRLYNESVNKHYDENHWGWLTTVTWDDNDPEDEDIDTPEAMPGVAKYIEDIRKWSEDSRDDPTRLGRNYGG